MTVVNKRTHTPTPNDVYIGRGSKWGNPFKITNARNREKVISMYKLWIQGTSLMKDLHELKDKTLVCYCAPLACHGNVLEELMKETTATSPYLNKPLRTQEKANEDISNHNKS